MRVFLTGVSCVGKTTVGRKPAGLLEVPFFDLDEEIEAFFGKPIERLRNQFMTVYSFVAEASRALESLLARPESSNSVIALPPGGLMRGYYQLIKKTEGIVIVLADDPPNILKKITLYDVDSEPIEKQLTDKEKQHYLKEIKKDITYYKRSYLRADLTVDISGLRPDENAREIKARLSEC